MKAILFGPCVGELYWESARFAPMLPYYKLKKYKNQNVKFIILTREERFDLYGSYADILVPLRIKGDYIDKIPNCFNLDNFSLKDYMNIVDKFNIKYKERFNIIEHLYPKIINKQFMNKNQFNMNHMIFKYKPRSSNYKLIESYIINNKPIIILASRFRKGFRRNWKNWPEFYNILYSEKELVNKYNFIICGKPGEYIPDEKQRFYDMNNITLTSDSSLVGLLLVLLERAFLTVGSQSSIPNLSLLYGVETLEFGCQKDLHTKTYNIMNTPVTFIENKNYNIKAENLLSELKNILKKRRIKMTNIWLEMNMPTIDRITHLLTECEYRQEYQKLPLRQIQGTLKGLITEIKNQQVKIATLEHQLGKVLKEININNLENSEIKE